MNRDQKTAVIDEIAVQLGEADAVFAVDYRGISVPQVAALRAKLRESDATFRIVKNSLTERAADQAGTAELKALLDGPTALTFVRGDAAAAAKALADAQRETQVLEFKGGLMDGATLSADDIKSISRLPSREVLTGQLVGLVASPLSGLARTLNALISGLAIALKQVHDEGKVSGTAPAAEPEAPPAAELEAPAAEAEPAPEAASPEASASDDTNATAEPDAGEASE